MIAAELRQELGKVNCVSITADGSNRKKQGRRRAGKPESEYTAPAFS